MKGQREIQVNRPKEEKEKKRKTKYMCTIYPKIRT